MRPYIKMYFYGRDTRPPLVQRIVPNGETGLCFYRGNKVTYSGVGEVGSCFASQTMHYIDIKAHGGIEIVGAHFTVLGARMFLPAPLNEYTNRILSVDDVGLGELERHVMEAATADECWGRMDSFFLQSLMRNDADELNLRRLHRAISYGIGHLDTVRIGDVATEACLSERQLGRLFSSFVGLSPKDYLRLQRYHKTLADMKRCRADNVTLTEIAWRNGYYDLSHFSSDFRKISGYSPSRLLDISENDGDEVGWRI